jgi:hypothetical protein
MMRKIIVIFSLIALLTFVVFPVAANSSATSLDEGEGGSSLITASHINDALLTPVSQVWRGLAAEQLASQSLSRLREWKILGHLISMIEEMARSPFSSGQ